ncbi:cation:proton antiporter [Immundisolibacter sp.]|uniref:cation:proton antiporter n=1 Tax=Immundisolibacter sp. TaxID=1934948 RepID=UPI002B17F854|nr:cation:proton antiporter [Immundisolibacter sp.]MEA3219402.1 Glutathione-regulated potassium-efflux system protein KefC [Immundisolibacter sp.]
MTTAHTVFNETAALLVLGAALGFVGQWLRQPLIVAFIVAGIVAGPDVLGVVSSAVHVQVLGELGVAVLLFLVGLKLDPGLLRTLGPVALVTGSAQVLLTALAGAGVALGLGMPVRTAAIIGLALTFSSTIIVIKLLWDKGEVDSLHGRLALGLLIAQDLLVVVLMGLLAGLRGESQGGLWQALVGGLVLLATVLLFTRYLAQGLLARMARSPELLVTFAVAWAALLAGLADALGLGKELGGLLAGVSLASTPFREALASRLASVRDFLLLFFFVSLGASLDFGALHGSLVPALVLSAFVLIGKPLIVLPILGLAGYGRRTAFMASLTLAQISEFSLILLALATQAGLADPATQALVTLVGLVSIGASTYLVTYSGAIYAFVEPLLARVIGDQARRQAPSEAPPAADVILFGLGRYGTAIADGLRSRGLSVLGVDFDPEMVARWRARGLPAYYGDAADPDFGKSLPLSGAQWVVCAIPVHGGSLTHDDPRLALVDALRNSGYRQKIAVAIQAQDDLPGLRGRDIDLVLLPMADAAAEAVDLITGAPLVAPRRWS